MPTFLSDPPRALYLLLFAAVIISVALAFRRQDRKSVLALAIAAGLLLVVWLVDTLVESPREEAVRRVLLMVKAAEALDREAFVAQAAEKIEYHGDVDATVTKDGLRNSPLWTLLKQYDVKTDAWDFERDVVKEVGPDGIEIGFMAHGKAQGTPYPLYFRATFRKQPNGEMKMTSLASFDMVNRNQRKGIPNFP